MHPEAPPVQQSHPHKWQPQDPDPVGAMPSLPFSAQWDQMTKNKIFPIEYLL